MDFREWLAEGGAVTEPAGGVTTVELAGTTYALTNEAGRLNLSADLREADAAPIAKHARVFTSGWNRNLISIHPDHLEFFAESTKSTPLLFNHDQERILGSVLSAEVQGRDVVQDLEYSEPLGKRLLDLKAEPRFSIRFGVTEETGVQCSACGKAFVGIFGEDDSCRHYPGEQVDGETVYLQATHVIGFETSHTFAPAVPGTGVLLSVMAEGAHAARADLFDQLTESQRLAVELRAQVEEGEQAKRELAFERGQRELERAEHDVKLAKKAGIPENPETLLEARQKLGPELFRRLFVDRLPTATARAFGEGVISGSGPTEPPELEIYEDRNWTTWLAYASKELANREGISLRAAHERLYNEYEETFKKATPRADTRRQVTRSFQRRLEAANERRD